MIHCYSEFRAYALIRQYLILSDECVSTKLGVTVNHVLVSLASPFYKYIYIYIYLLKTELRILDFQHFHWLAGHRLSAHIPALPNMVNESINKESWIKKFPRNWRPLKIV